jgi:hypothetical protein
MRKIKLVEGKGERDIYLVEEWTFRSQDGGADVQCFHWHYQQ